MPKRNEPGMAYDTKKLNVVFVFLSFLLLMSTLWLFLDDYIRPWKKVQLDALKIRKEKIQKEIAAADKEVKKKDLEKVRKEIAAAEKIVKGREKQLEKLNDQLNELGKKLHQQTITTGTHNAMVSQLQFEYGIAYAHHEKKKAKKLLKELTIEKELLASARDKLKNSEGRKKKILMERDKLRQEVVVSQGKMKKLTEKKNLLNTALESSKISAVFALRNAPMIDFMDPTLKISQIVLPHIKDDRYFQQVPKVDRCTTCHTFIDQPGYENNSNPHKTHPNLDLILGARSPHPMKKIGCTVCHGGEGHRVFDMVAVAHMPDTPEKRKSWEEKYNWHEPHKVPQVMHKSGHTEAGCVKCHGEVEYLPGATVLNEGRRNMNRFGCFACHKIKGWEHKKKPGPSLLKVAGKINKEFFKNWVWDPKSFNKHARMPSFFTQMNNSKEEFVRKNIAEVSAMADFIWDKSKSYEPFLKYTGGDASRGKRVIGEVGCLGCHGVEGLEEKSRKIDAVSAPYLSGVGSKVSGDWLVSWLARPSHYSPDSIMPSFRLSNSELQDVAAYLLSLKNERFEQMRFTAMDKKLRDEILTEYFSAFDTIEVAKMKLKKMSDRERTLELGKRSIGKYGCYSCHDIEGFAGRVPIGPELTFIGSKPLTQLGFNHEHDVEHSLSGWLKAHLLSPRRWDNGMDKPFKDLLRMPQFYMSERQAETITVALLGQVSEKIPLAGIKRLDAHEAMYNEAIKVVNDYNCIGCHQVDGLHGDILKAYEDINEGPPRLVNQGHRVQTDWFYHFLKDVTPIRPGLKVRMPTFNLSHEERNKIVMGFQAKALRPTFTDLKVRWEKGEREAAKKLFVALDCATCHTQGFNREPPTAPNLYLSKKRLRPSWIEKWLGNPNAILDGTVMPNFWEDGEATEPNILGGDPDRQIKALTKYIMEL
ncbi:MAG: c-type cytochrome [Halobacteriovoraceae bacterium]|nr:c-type cytochrome [Halobacteriovoraceae bacterium]